MMESKLFKFYHADRMMTLSENTRITPDKGGLSNFGKAYEPYFGVPFEDIPTEAQREIWLEIIRKETRAFSENRPSRFSCLFAALNISDAIQFAKTITPIPTDSVKIFEVYASYYFIADMNNLDIDTEDKQKKAQYMYDYWLTKIYQGCLVSHNPRMPRLEVLLPLPVQIGKVVAIAPGCMGGERLT
jgi:hypothetical protein